MFQSLRSAESIEGKDISIPDQSNNLLIDHTNELIATEHIHAEGDFDENNIDAMIELDEERTEDGSREREPLELSPMKGARFPMKTAAGKNDDIKTGDDSRKKAGGNSGND